MSTAASIALIFLIVETMFAALVFLALFAAMVYGMHKLRGLLKRLFPKAQEITQQVSDITRQVSDRVAAPFLWAQGSAAGARAGVRRAWRNLTSK